MYDFWILWKITIYFFLTRRRYRTNVFIFLGFSSQFRNLDIMLNSNLPKCNNQFESFAFLYADPFGELPCGILFLLVCTPKTISFGSFCQHWTLPIRILYDIARSVAEFTRKIECYILQIYCCGGSAYMCRFGSRTRHGRIFVRFEIRVWVVFRTHFVPIWMSDVRYQRWHNSRDWWLLDVLKLEFPSLLLRHSPVYEIFKSIH